MKQLIKRAQPNKELTPVPSTTRATSEGKEEKDEWKEPQQEICQIAPPLVSSQHPQSNNGNQNDEFYFGDNNRVSMANPSESNEMAKRYKQHKSSSAASTSLSQPIRSNSQQKPKKGENASTYNTLNIKLHNS